MYRNIERKLQLWRERSGRKPLIIRGARQVGKTYSVRQFAKEYFDNYVFLDFEKDLTLATIFQGNLSPREIVMEIELHMNCRIVPGKTLLFMDEIQECERALLSLRYFYEEMPDLHVIAVGSMLEFALENISFPVGRVSFEWMYPMSFDEFLIASGKELLAKAIPSISDYMPVSNGIHNLITIQIKKYFIVGGMPEAVKIFFETSSFSDVSRVHEELLYSCFQSLSKYEKKTDIESLNHVMRSVPRYVGSQLKYTGLDPDRRIEKTKRSLQILNRALIVHLIHSTVADALPLGAGCSAKTFKPLFIDIGLMQHACGFDPNSIIKSNSLSHAYKGALAEQFVGQELLSQGGSENGKLYYWSRNKKNSSAEIDYLIIKQGVIYPIEVKSGKAGRLKSMHLYLDEVENSTIGYVLSSAMHQEQAVDNLVFMPFYVRF